MDCFAAGLMTGGTRQGIGGRGRGAGSEDRGRGPGSEDRGRGDLLLTVPFNFLTVPFLTVLGFDGTFS